MPLVKPFTEAFCGGSYSNFALNAGLSARWDNERSINLYPEIGTPEGTTKTSRELVGRPGLLLFGTLPQSPVRALWAGALNLYAVGGTHFYKLNSNGTVNTDYGAMSGSAGSGPCQILANGTQLLVMDSSVSSSGQQTGAIFNANNVGPAMNNVFTGSALAYLDGFYVAINNAASIINQVNVSNFLDGTTWNALNFTQRTGSADLLMQLETLNGMLWMFGEKSTEVWYDAGSPTFPFARIQGATLNIGLLQRWSVVKFYNTIIWIGADERGFAAVYRAAGLSPVRISNPGVEYLIGSYAGNSALGAICYGYQEAGHTFYCINLSAAPNHNAQGGLTLCYDLATGLWHERTYLTPGTGVVTQFLPQCVASLPQFSGAGDFVYAGDYNSGNIYYQSVTNGADNTAPIQYIRRSPALSESDRWTRFESLEVDADIGSAQLQLDYSNDGGVTFPGAHTRGPISASPANGYGSAAGGYGRFKFWQLGRSRHRVFQSSVTTSSQHVRLLGAYLRASAGTEN